MEISHQRANIPQTVSLSPLATTSAIIPSDLALNSLNVHTLIANDIMANGSLFAQTISAYDTDLFIQPSGDKPVHIMANIMNIYPDGKILINGKEDTITYSLNQNIQTIHSQMESRCVRIAEDKGWSIYKGKQIHS